MRVLSAFSSVGIAETLIYTKYPELQWHAVDNEGNLLLEYQKRFPRAKCFNSDAYNFIYNHHKDFDIIMATPPCQSYSRLTRVEDRTKPDTKIFDLIAFLHLEYPEGSKTKWIVENVNSNFLRKNTPLTTITKIGRHLFWSNVRLDNRFTYPVRTFRFDKGTYKRNGLSQTETHVQDLQGWLGVKLSKRFYIRGNHSPAQIYREGIHPKLALYVFDQLLKPKKNILDWVNPVINQQ